MDECAADVGSNKEFGPTECTDNSSKNKATYRKAPNRQRFEESINEIKLQIESKEKEVQTLLASDSLQVKLQELRDSREAINQKRRSINTQLEVLNQQINTKRDATSQLRSKLQYQTEAQVDQVVRRLESQLQQHSFRLAEERRLVAEIDKLRRSKKAVKQYNDSKDELQVLRDNQQKLRVERDTLSKELINIRAQEDNAHATIRKNREAIDILKKELDELYDKKRAQVAEFKADQALYLQCRDQRRAEANRLRAQEKLAQARAQDRQEIQVCSSEPYQEERYLCATLLSFLGKLETATPTSTPATPLSCTSSMCSTPITPDEANCRLPGCREELEEGLHSSIFLGIPRRPSRKAKRSNSRAGLCKKRLVPLTPDLLAQFASLSITAPTSVTEVPTAIETLKAKQKLFACMANAEAKQNNSTNSCNKVSTIPETFVDNTQTSEKEATIKLSPESLSLDLSVPLASSPSLQQNPIDSTTSQINGLPESN